MGFGAAIRAGFSKYVVFEGRSSRSEFWWFWLFTILVTMAAVIVDNIFGLTFGPSGQNGVLSSLWNLAVLLPSLSMQIRRLHDTDHSGWWVLIAFTIIGIIPLFIWMCSKSTEGENKYGPMPEGTPTVAGSVPRQTSGGNQYDYERLEKLGNLRDKGIITDEEFQQQKARLLEGGK